MCPADCATLVFGWQAVLSALLVLKEDVTDKTVRRSYLWCECVLAHLPSSSQVVIRTGSQIGRLSRSHKLLHKYLGAQKPRFLGDHLAASVGRHAWR